MAFVPRSVSDELKSHLAGSPLTVARLFLISRRDGAELALTDASSRITYQRRSYEPIDGVGTTAQQESLGSGVDNAEVYGFLSDARITEADLAAGRYDGARIRVMLVNRNDLTMGHVTLFAGLIGEVTVMDGRFSAQLRSLSQLLHQKIGDVTSPTCRCSRLGNAQCKVNMSGNAVGGTPIRRTGVALSAVVSSKEIRWSDSAPSGFYSGGVVKVTSGANAGLERVIKAHTNSSGTAAVTLRLAFPFALAVGSTITVEAGCDRTFETCRDKFANAVNFHGEPDLPGNDRVQMVGRTNGK